VRILTESRDGCHHNGDRSQYKPRPSLAPAHGFALARPLLGFLKPSHWDWRSLIQTTSFVRSAWLALFTAVMASCAGPWAQPTHVVLETLHGSSNAAQADVVEATICVNNRCRPQGGSTVVIIVNRAKPHTIYRATLATGSCERPTGRRDVAQFDGTDGLRAHLDTPIIPLTSGKYILVLKRLDDPQAPGACGVIKRGWPW
jgi:hypothetical protein